jgi:hypothetical protein
MRAWQLQTRLPDGIFAVKLRNHGRSIRILALKFSGRIADNSAPDMMSVDSTAAGCSSRKPLHLSMATGEAGDISVGVS